MRRRTYVRERLSHTHGIGPRAAMRVYDALGALAVAWHERLLTAKLRVCHDVQDGPPTALGLKMGGFMLLHREGGRKRMSSWYDLP